jgi:hypothetical protein
MSERSEQSGVGSGSEVVDSVPSVGVCRYAGVDFELVWCWWGEDRATDGGVGCGLRTVVLI